MKIDEIEINQMYDIKTHSSDVEEQGIVIKILEDNFSSRHPIFPLFHTFNVSNGKFQWLRADVFIKRL